MATDEVYLEELKGIRTRLIKQYEYTIGSLYPATIARAHWRGIKRITREIDRIENGGFFGN